MLPVLLVALSSLAQLGMRSRVEPDTILQAARLVESLKVLYAAAAIQARPLTPPAASHPRGC